jgi:hypothetical protein
MAASDLENRWRVVLDLRTSRRCVQTHNPRDDEKMCQPADERAFPIFYYRKQVKSYVVCTERLCMPVRELVAIVHRV